MPFELYMARGFEGHPPRVRVLFPGTPVGQGRPRISTGNRGARSVRAIDPAKARAWKSNAKSELNAAMFDLSEKAVPRPLYDEDWPLCVRIDAVWPCPKSDHLKRRLRPKRVRKSRPDADNVIKCVLDACNGLLWQDDAQVVDVRCLKYIAAQDERPHVELWVHVAEELKP